MSPCWNLRHVRRELKSPCWYSQCDGHASCRFLFSTSNEKNAHRARNDEKNLRSHSWWESPTAEGEQRHRVDLEKDRSRTLWNRPSRTEGNDDCRETVRDLTRVSWLLIHLVNAFFWISSRSSTNERLVETILDRRSESAVRFEYDERQRCGETNERERKRGWNERWMMSSFV